MTVAATIDGESMDAKPGPVDRWCGSQHPVDDQVLDSHVAEQGGSSADRAACDARKDIVGILADTVACDRRMELLAGPVDILDTSHGVVEANATLVFQRRLDDVEQLRSAVELELLDCVESDLRH